MKITEIKKYEKEYNGVFYPRADLCYGQDPLFGRIVMTENTQVYREVSGMMCLAGRGFNALQAGMEVTPVFFVDRYGNNVLQSVIINSK